MSEESDKFNKQQKFKYIYPCGRKVMVEILR